MFSIFIKKFIYLLYQKTISLYLKYKKRAWEAFFFIKLTSVVNNNNGYKVYPFKGYWE